MNHGGRCPHCSRFTKKVKEYYNKHIIHSIFIKDPSTIIYQARRFICPECNTTFYESNPFIKCFGYVNDKDIVGYLLYEDIYDRFDIVNLLKMF